MIAGLIIGCFLFGHAVGTLNSRLKAANLSVRGGARLLVEGV
jgi:hypothetical protein